MARGEAWAAMDAVSRHPATRMQSHDLPKAPGVVVWFRDGEPVWVGVARGANGLRGRVGADQSRSMNIATSPLRIAVAVKHVGVDPDRAGASWSAMTPAEVGAVNRWVEQCAVGWIQCESTVQANALERALLNEWEPPLNRS